ncbi:MAG: hypothetical protein ACOY9D_07885 [Pseudomonadota bacterium]
MKLALARFFQVGNPLSRYSKDITSQNGEDGIVEHIIGVISPENHYCVEFGAWDGKHFSNCYNLIKNKSWQGVMIEANAEKYKELVRTYSDNANVKCVNKFVQFEGHDTLDNILDEANAPKDIGVLSIDIDGNDYHVWESLQKFTPELVIIEFNPTIPNDVIFVQKKSPGVNQGCSLLSLIFLGKKLGYELACCTKWNAFFVKKEKFDSLGVSDNFIFRMYQPIQDGRIFQGYDSYIHVIGMNTLIWKEGVNLSPEDFQVLPESSRGWSDAQKK